jgi:hypothetical protein
MQRIVFHKEWYDIIAMMNQKRKLQFYDLVMTYAFTGEVVGHDEALDAAFQKIKTVIDRESASYEKRCAANRLNGQKGGRPGRENTGHEKPIGFPDETETKPNKNPLGFENPTKTHWVSEQKSEKHLINNNTKSNNKDINNISTDVDINNTTNSNINVLSRKNHNENPLGFEPDEKSAAADAATLKKTLEKRKLEFEKKLVPFMVGHGGQYSGEMLRAFADYWTEPNRSQTKMRFELERTWELKRRLTTWATRERVTPRQKPEQSQRIAPLDALRDFAAKLSNNTRQEIKTIEQ